MTGKKKTQHIVWHNSRVSKQDRQALNGFRSCVLWLTGLSGAGKSTLAMALEKELYRQQIRAYVLDGDNLRHGLNQNLGFSHEDRIENIRRIGEVSKLLVDVGILAITAVISPYEADRERVRSLLGDGEFIEVYVKCSIQECERRDPKGLYKKARAGEIREFTGISAPYEEPKNPEMIIESDRQTIRESVQQILSYLKSKGYIDD